MEVIALASVDSTSTHAATLLSSGQKPPFAVWAREQTGGRGQRGRQWTSPAGNLYLTLALPPPDCTLAEAGLSSLKAGIIVARLAQQYCGLRLTLKWPNDLLFAGRKIGGLLLESATHGQRAGDLLIGIGFNLNIAPPLGSAGTALQYQSIALADALGRAVDVEAFVARVCAGFPDAWAALPWAEVPTAAAEFMIGVGQRWVRLAPPDAPAGASGAPTPDAGEPAPVAAHGVGIDRDGALLLQPIGAPAARRFLSADHGWRWLHQTEAAAPLAVADVGNSATKIAWFAAARDVRPSWLRTLPHDADDRVLLAALSELGQKAPGAAWPLFILSVRPPAAQRLQTLAERAGWTASLLAKRPVRRHGAHYALSALGSDRLAAIEGWLADLTPEQRGRERSAGIVVVAGTATTIDAVTTSGEHLGGLILPGLGLALSSLHQAASLLPALDAVSELRAAVVAECLGSDTRTAMLRAAVQMTVGAVEQVRRDLRERRELVVEDGAVVVSGGGGNCWRRWLGGLGIVSWW